LKISTDIFGIKISFKPARVGVLMNGLYMVSIWAIQIFGQRRNFLSIFKHSFISPYGKNGQIY